MCWSLLTSLMDLLVWLCLVRHSCIFMAGWAGFLHLCFVVSMYPCVNTGQGYFGEFRKEKEGFRDNKYFPEINWEWWQKVEGSCDSDDVRRVKAFLSFIESFELGSCHSTWVRSVSSSIIRSAHGSPAAAAGPDEWWRRRPPILGSEECPECGLGPISHWSASRPNNSTPDLSRTGNILWYDCISCVR